MCEDEQYRDIEKENRLLYATEMKTMFNEKIDDLFNAAVNEYIDNGGAFPLGIGRCLEFVKEYIKKNI